MAVILEREMRVIIGERGNKWRDIERNETNEWREKKSIPKTIFLLFALH